MRSDLSPRKSGERLSRSPFLVRRVNLSAALPDPARGRSAYRPAWGRMKIALLVLLGLLLGALGGAALGVGAGLAWVEIFKTSNFEGYSGMLVFFGLHARRRHCWRARRRNHLRPAGRPGQGNRHRTAGKPAAKAVMSGVPQHLCN